MTHRQAALGGGIAAVAIALLAAGATVLARREPPAPPAEPPPAVPAPPAPVPAVATTTASTTPAAVPLPDAVLAQAYVVADLATGEVLDSRRSADRWPLASLTKLMTATVALHRIAPDEPVAIVPVPGGNPSSPGIPVGQTFAMRDVLAVMLIASSNEAAESLAAHVGREEFIAEMNATAAAWGLADTFFYDASGLSAADQSTAADVLAIALRVERDNPQVFAITREPARTVYAQGTGVAYTARATHQLVLTPGFLGGKTGFTDEAKGNLLSLFRVGARSVAFVVLGSDRRFDDTRSLLSALIPHTP